jgi:cytochrome c oxidase cbb3-type subunit I/II
MKEVTVTYDDVTVRRFLLASVVWGLVGMLLGVVVACQLAFPQLNLAAWFSFGRLRPLHTNAVIFAFVGNMIFAGVYYSTQRLCKARLPSAFLSAFHFYGWQGIIVAAALTLPFGYTQGKEYAELEWPIDIAITLTWVAFAINFFWTLNNRREKHLFVALWFYIATIITVAVLHVVNSLALPVMVSSGLKSYPVYAGVQDALVQWWYGHNAVAFFLTTPILGIMYYFLPKAAERPIYSYRLSIIHFWALIFMYIWAGPHHLLYTALPDWAQSMGMIFSLMLWAPSWGGMINGLLTLRGAWDRLRRDPVLKFFAAGITFYGMATFEGPLLSIKSVSGLAHYTDWIIGHVHTGALGWNGFFAAGMFYFLVPRLWNRELHSKAAADLHFWLGTLGILLYTVSMWVSGVTQGLMWRATNPDGTLLYPSFVETLLAIRPMYYTRIVGGSLYLIGFCLMAWNLAMTIRAGVPVESSVRVVEPDPTPEVPWRRLLFAHPVILCGAGLAVMLTFFITERVELAALLLGAMGVLVVITWLTFALGRSEDGQMNFHRLLEGRPLLFTVLALISVLIGGVAEILPTIVVDRAVPKSGPVATPYRPLEVHGRDIYVREGCYLCHSQMIRPFPAEKVRYGEPSTAGEFIYDHPFQWGSKRTGPDLHRVGGKYSHLWHYQHLLDPRSTSPGSNMPSYEFLTSRKLDLGDTAVKLAALKTLGVPYGAAEIAQGNGELEASARAITKDLATQGVELPWDSEMVALIAYLQRLGKNPPVQPSGPAPSPPASAQR